MASSRVAALCLTSALSLAYSWSEAVYFSLIGSPSTGLSSSNWGPVLFILSMCGLCSAISSRICCRGGDTLGLFCRRHWCKRCNCWSDSHPELLLLLPESLVLDGRRRQLAEGGQGLLKPRPHLLVGLPELNGQRLGSLQLQAALRVQLADHTVLVQQRLSFGLKFTPRIDYFSSCVEQLEEVCILYW